MIANESPQFVSNAYNKWVFSRTRESSYHSSKEFCQDSHLYKYSSLQSANLSSAGTTLGPEGDELWTKIEHLFTFPDEKVGGGNIRRRSIESSKVFANAYFYKLATGCPWCEVPAVKNKLILPGGLQQKVTVLRKNGILNKLTEVFFSIYQIDKELPI